MIELTGLQQRIFAAVRQAGEKGLACSQIVDLVYGHRADGGPLWARTCIWVTIFEMNKTLRANGLVMKSSHGRSEKPYKIHQLEQHETIPVKGSPHALRVWAL